MGPTDDATYAVVVLALGAIAAVTSYIPDRRASRMEPAAVLRIEQGLIS